MAYKLVAHRSAILAGTIDYDSLPPLMSELARLDQRVDRKNGIVLFLNTPGGSAGAGLAIYDFLNTLHNKLTTVALGECSSIGMVILQAGQTRLVSPHARMLLHYGLADVSAHGQVDAGTLAKSAGAMKRLDENILRIVSRRVPAVQRDTIDALLREESYLTPVEAVQYGLADAIL